jgi:Cu+-exporting ATPase
MTKDPICGMTVDEAQTLSAERDGQTFYFCGEHCRQKFLESGEPKAESGVPGAAAHECCQSVAAVGNASGSKRSSLRSPPVYTCPMHPEVQQDHPGDCPKCGMALEPKTVAAGTDDEENAELRNMTRRFWIGAALKLPIFVLAMAHIVPVLGELSWVTGEVSRWIQFVLTIPVVCSAGWPFFQRGWRSVVTLHLNMFTLIAIGVGAAFIFSAVAMLAPGLFRSDQGAPRTGVGNRHAHRRQPP